MRRLLEVEAAIDICKREIVVSTLYSLPDTTYSILQSTYETMEWFRCLCSN